MTWAIDKNRFDCPRCKTMQKDGFVNERCSGIQFVEECPAKRIPKLSSSNYLFWEFFSKKVSLIVFNGMGGSTLSGVKELLDVYNVPQGQRPIFYNKLFCVIGEINVKKAKT